MAVKIPAKQVGNGIKPSQIDLSSASAGSDPADRNYVNNQITASVYGRDMKESVRVASTTNLTLGSPGAAIDGVTLVVGDRVLLKNQTTASQNGIYAFNGSSSALTRALDANTSAKVTSQMAVSVEEGSTNANTTWKLNTAGPITLDTTALVFSLFSTNYYATPSTSNKNMTAVATTNDNDVACNTGIAATPAQGSYVEVMINGQTANVGNGTKTGCECYFSGDSGTTPRGWNAVISGDKLYWVGSVAGMQLDANDRIDFNYVV